METLPNKNDSDRDLHERSPYAVGYEWSVRISSIGLEMALPPAAGIWLDSRCGTLPLFTILGAVFGMTTAMIHLIQIGKTGVNLPVKKDNPNP